MSNTYTVGPCGGDGSGGFEDPAVAAAKAAAAEAVDERRAELRAHDTITPARELSVGFSENARLVRGVKSIIADSVWKLPRGVWLVELDSVS